MTLLNLLMIAFRAIAANKMRSFLTMLGIIIGVASVIAMLAIGQGTKESIAAEISSMGSNMIMVMPGQDMRGGARQDASAMETLKMADYEAIRSECQYVKAVSPYVSKAGQFIYGNNNTPASLYGVGTDYLEIRQLNIKDGVMFTEQDIKQSAKVCVIGKTVIDNLFPDGQDPIGKTIRCNSIPFRIIGVLKSKGYNTMGMDQDNMVLTPYTTVMKRMLAQTHLSQIMCSAVTQELTDKAIEEITVILRSNHKLKDPSEPGAEDGDEDDFNIRSQEELASTLNNMTGMLTILLASIAGISLLVGGIGIMNIMYVSVTERTKEIGLRMAVGARGFDILNQFLIESILLSVTGGVIGVVIGFGICQAVEAFANLAVTVLPWSVVLAFAVCTITGIFFGWYPAKKAARLDPIEALRYE
ncbi:MAG: ABC transporter permease [Bacteroidaceae bacterium]|nr:ABC transporter permease [Bacteroidaceae bacterium]